MVSQIKAKKVYVGLSGGVDSSVSAALLKDAGYNVTGVFIKVWQPDWIECTWKEDRLDAMRVSAKLDIPFVTLDLSKEYKKEVVDYMIAEYKAGNTPNPDVMCNRYVKFGGFYKFARNQGADYVATGHYARIVERLKIKDLSNKKNQNERQSVAYNLLAGKDDNKDQSYFLWTLTQEQLAHTLFPVGDLEKSTVRKLAKKFGLATADKKDSQGLCFLGKIDVKEFLKQFISEKRGKVVNEKGEEIGEHNGAFFFTLGERHGFDILKKTSTDKPYYVIGKNVDKNILVVSNDPIGISNSGGKKSFSLSNTNWINKPEPGRICAARIRYRQPLQKIKFIKVGDYSTIEFETEQDGGDSGQSIVVYDGEICIGGGIIVKK